MTCRSVLGGPLLSSEGLKAYDQCLPFRCGLQFFTLDFLVYMYSIVAEQIDETDIRKIPQIVWAESESLIVPVYSSVYCQPHFEIQLPVITALVLFSSTVHILV
jgi:hypothetical protein